jgi:hypothetical protein
MLTWCLRLRAVNAEQVVIADEAPDHPRVQDDGRRPWAEASTMASSGLAAAS